MALGWLPWQNVSFVHVVLVACWHPAPASVQVMRTVELLQLLPLARDPAHSGGLYPAGQAHAAPGSAPLHT
jgi:hypothetical protein